MSTDPFQYEDGPRLGLNWQSLDHISRRLKSAYEQVAHEPVPDRFADLLEQLEQVESQPGTTVDASSAGLRSPFNGEHRQ